MEGQAACHVSEDNSMSVPPIVESVGSCRPTIQNLSALSAPSFFNGHHFFGVTKGVY